MKLGIILVALLMLAISCSQDKKDLKIKLHSENGYGIFQPGRQIIFPSKVSIKHNGIPNEVEEFVIRTLSLQNEQLYWDLYKEQNISRKMFLEYITSKKIDTTKLTNINYDYTVSILVGTNKESKRVIIIDSDNDEDFRDERILKYDYPIELNEQKGIEDNLPTILTNYEYYLEGKVIKRSINLKPSPYRGTLSLKYGGDNEIEKKYDLFLSVPEYRKGETNIDGITYEIFVSNGFIGSSYLNERISIFISKKGNKISELNGDIPYSIKDIVNLQGNDYLIENISIWGEKIIFKYLGKNSYPEGFSEGLYVPKFNAQKLDNSIFTLEQYPDMYVLLDFWGTWCKPCIQQIPDLKQLNSAFKQKNFVLVSVAYDNNVNKVAEFIKKENMDWQHIFVDQKMADKNSLVEKLKVNSFPTTILIAPDRKIIARNKSMDELKKILLDSL